ncbi:type VI secretion system tube protein TssD [Tenacibaculum sp. ZH5_bin.1]|uniref:type VI secretion system tube protein TssD n=1 Tax=Tenacibaculum TaxID=104267 RepID=UPI001430DEFC|nr:type VI secretion system tube protein TssD [Tenacibaculum mesophilum]KAF9658229.1 hypothetical protein HBA12_13570 [Tenacibaculum mesophilum]
MNIKAKLFICGEERELLTTNLNYNRLTDWNGKPTSALLGGTISVTFESEMYDDTFVDWIKSDRRGNKKIRHPFNLYQLRDGKIVFYKDEFDGVELFQYNFQDGVLVNYYETFDNQKGMQVTLTISPAMQDYRFFNNSTDWRRKSTTRYIKPWQESFIPPIEDTPYKAKETNKSEKKPQIISGWWTKNKNDRLNLKKANLGNTVYFHIETKNINDGEEIDCKLYDLDKFLWDYLYPDDDKFNKKEVHKKAIVRNNKATIELFLNQKWEQNLVEDRAYDIELYWKVSYKETIKNLPNREKLYLNVTFSDRTLFFKPSIAGGKLPQLIANDGSPLFLAELKEATIDEVEDIAKSRIKDKVKKKAEKLVSSAVAGYNNAIESRVTTIALAKLAKGTMVDTNGKIHTKPRKIYQYTEEVFNKEVIVKRGRRFDNGVVKSAANQAHYFATNGTNVEILNTLRIRPLMSAEDASETFSKIFSLVDFSTMSLEEITDTPLNVPDFLLKRFLPKTPIVGISLWLEFLGYVALVEHEKQEAMVDQIMQEKLERAKIKGLDALRTFLHVYETDYELRKVTSKTLGKLLTNNFKTLNDLLDFDAKTRGERNIELLIKKDNKTNPVQTKTIIESIFFSK